MRPQVQILLAPPVRRPPAIHGRGSSAFGVRPGASRFCRRMSTTSACGGSGRRGAGQGKAVGQWGAAAPGQRTDGSAGDAGRRIRTGACRAERPVPASVSACGERCGDYRGSRGDSPPVSAHEKARQLFRGAGPSVQGVAVYASSPLRRAGGAGSVGWCGARQRWRGASPCWRDVSRSAAASGAQGAVSPLVSASTRGR